MNLRSRSALQSDINITPLVDVCLVLLITAMVATPLFVNGAVRLPITHTAEQMGDRDHQLSITVRDDGTVYLGTIAVRREQAAAELARLHRESPDRPVAVRGDARVAYGEVVAVLDACRAAGFSEVGLVSERR